MNDNPSRPDRPADAPAPTHREIVLILIPTMLGMFLAALDQTIVAPALPTIGVDLGDLEHVSWIVTAYLVAATAATPLLGKASDIVGRRVVMLSAIAVFVLGSVACALAPTMATLAVARAIQGLGGGGLISLAQTIIADLVAPKERARYQVFIAGVFLSSSLLGPVLGGFFAAHVHWTMIFWINVPLGAVAFVMGAVMLKRLPRHEQRRRLDLLGALLMVAGTVALMLALSWGGVRHAWTAAPILALLALSAVLWSLFLWRMRRAPEPLIPTEIFANNVVLAATLTALLGYGVFVGLSIYMPIYMQGAFGLDPAGAGLALIPLMVGTVVGATTSGRLMLRSKHYKRLPLAGLTASAAGTLALALWPDRPSFIVVEIILALLSFGLGTMLPVTTVSIQNAVAPHQMGTATGSMNFFRQLGAAIIVSAFGAILFAGLKIAPGTGGTHEMIAHLVTSGTGLRETFQWIFAAASVGLLLAALALWTMEERPLRGRIDPPAAAD